jgi:hypothetical protein
MPVSSIIGMLLNPEDGDNTFSKTLMNFCRLHVPENCTAPVVSLLNPCKVPLSWNSAVGVATGYELNDQEFGVRDSVGSRIFTSAFCPYWPWGPPSLLCNGYWALFSLEKSAKGVKLTTPLQLVPR